MLGCHLLVNCKTKERFSWVSNFRLLNTQKVSLRLNEFRFDIHTLFILRYRCLIDQISSMIVNILIPNWLVHALSNQAPTLKLEERLVYYFSLLTSEGYNHLVSTLRSPHLIGWNYKGTSIVQFIQNFRSPFRDRNYWAWRPPTPQIVPNIKLRRYSDGSCVSQVASLLQGFPWRKL